MGPDVDVLQPWAIGQGESEGRLAAALPASGFEDVGDGAGAEGVAFESDGDGGGQLLRPVVVEQGEQVWWRARVGVLRVLRGARRAWRWRGR